VTCAWYAEPNDPWIDIVDGESFTGDGIMRIVVLENQSSSPRSGSVTVGNGASLSTLSINQAGTGSAGCDVLAANASSTSVPAGGTGTPVSVSVVVGGPDCFWSAISNAGWLAVSPGAGNGSGSFFYSATSNTSPSPRSATITVASGTAAPVSITITQEGDPCSTLQAEAASTSIAASGTSVPVTVAVTVPSASCTWGATSTASWLEVLGGSGTGSGAFSFVVAEHLSTSSRSAQLLVTSGSAPPVSITITQSGYGLCAAPEQLSPESASTSSASGSGVVEIATPTGTCAWEAMVTSGGEWLSIVSGGSGIGAGTLGYAFAENLGSTSRIGVITLSGGGTFTLTQSGSVGPCGPWTPAALPSLRAWYDAADASTITGSVDGLVSEWRDKSGLGYHVTATGSDRPSYTEDGLDSKSVVTFDGGNRLSAAVASDWRFLHDSTGSTVAMVTRAGVPGGSSRMGLLWTNPFSSPVVGLCLTQNFGGIFYALNSRGSGQWVFLNQSSGNAWPSGSTAVLTHVGDPANAIPIARSVSRVNGGQPMAFNTRTAAPSAADPAFALQIGAGGFSSMAGLDGFMAEIVI
jgi:hypothetical protein